MALVTKRPFLAALAGLVLLLAVAIGLELAFGTRATDVVNGPGRPAASPDAKLLPPLLAQAPEQVYPEMAARPLFTPTRRPAPVEPTAGQAQLVRGQYILQGVIVVGDQRTALLKEKSTGKVHRVDRGKELNGITVERVEPTEVTLVAGSERENVALVVNRPERAQQAPAAAGPAAGPFAPQAAPPAAAPAAMQAGGPAAHTGAPAATPVAPTAGVNRPGPAPVAGNPATPGSPTAQPMSPEELLARRRARRNQPTQ